MTRMERRRRTEAGAHHMACPAARAGSRALCSSYHLSAVLPTSRPSFIAALWGCCCPRVGTRAARAARQRSVS